MYIWLADLCTAFSYFYLTVNMLDPSLNKSYLVSDIVTLQCVPLFAHWMVIHFYCNYSYIEGEGSFKSSVTWVMVLFMLYFLFNIFSILAVHLSLLILCGWVCVFIWLLFNSLYLFGTCVYNLHFNGVCFLLCVLNKSLA